MNPYHLTKVDSIVWSLTSEVLPYSDIQYVAVERALRHADGVVVEHPWQLDESAGGLIVSLSKLKQRHVGLGQLPWGVTQINSTAMTWGSI